MMRLPRVSDWPMWLQVVVFLPHAVLAGVLMWVWWPKEDDEWFRFLGWAAYLLAFYLVMRFVFGF